MSTDDARIGVVVVAFNAASTLISTLDRIPQHFRRDLAEVIILDDASHDDTYAQARAWAERQPDITSVVLRHEKNLGYGGNQKAAFALASERGLDVVALLHGDGQYDPTYLPQLVHPILDGTCEAVFGSRMMVKGAARAGGMPLYKRVGNRILTRFENRLLGTDLTEFHSGYRAYKVSALDELPLEHNSDGFDFDTQIIVQLVDRGMRIGEQPIPTYYGDEICYVNGVRYAADVVRDVVEYRFAKLGFGTSRWVPAPDGYSFKEGDGSSHALILAMLEGRPPCRILDLGCSGGQLARRLRARGHHVTGVDQLEVEGVRDRTDAFHLADLSRGIPEGLAKAYDVVVAADVLEHLPRPEQIVHEIRLRLSPNGELLVSLPNFGHWYPRGRVAIGAFGYDRRGPLDDTHLRFYSRRTVRRLFRRTGFDLVEERYTGLPWAVVSPNASPKTRVMQTVDRSLVTLRPQLFAYQFVLRLRPHREGVEMAVFEGTASRRAQAFTGGDAGV